MKEGRVLLSASPDRHSKERTRRPGVLHQAQGSACSQRQQDFSRSLQSLVLLLLLIGFARGTRSMGLLLDFTARTTRTGLALFPAAIWGSKWISSTEGQYGGWESQGPKQ